MMAAGALTTRQLAAEEKVAKASRALPSPKIKDVQVIATAPDGLRLVVVKILTDRMACTATAAVRSPNAPTSSLSPLRNTCGLF